MGTIGDMAFLAGLGAAAMLLWILPALIARAVPWQLIRGADGKASTSKLQFMVWTTVVVFAYVAIFVERCRRGDFSAIDNVPHNLLLAMGASGATVVTAKAITTNYVATGRVNKTIGGLGGVFAGDDGMADLSKVQLVAWTGVGVVVYLVTLAKSDPKNGLPDIDAVLMVLMGLGHAAYIGKKLVTTDTPQLLSVTSFVRAGTPVVITGTSFGVQTGDVLVDNLVLSGLAMQWTDTSITFALPAAHPNGSAWTEGLSISVGVNANGGAAANTLRCTVGLAPRPVSLDVTKAKPGDSVHIGGDLLTGSSVIVTVDGAVANVVANSARDIQFTVPPTATNPVAAVLVTVDGNAANKALTLDVG